MPKSTGFSWQFQNQKKQIKHIQKILLDWLNERADVFRLYVDNVSGLRLARGEERLDTFQAFGQTLMDYLGKGHFQIYQEFEKGTKTESNIDAWFLAELRERTEKFVAFNDRYFAMETDTDLDADIDANAKAFAPTANNAVKENYAQQIALLLEGGDLSEEARMTLHAMLTKDLSDLGEALGNYVDLEDQWLAQYLKQASQILPSYILSHLRANEKVPGTLFGTKPSDFGSLEDPSNNRSKLR